jgi:probable DNA repair protein
MENHQDAAEATRLSRSGLLGALADGAAVLTGNARLSRHLKAEFGRHMLDQGREAWPTPAVIPLDAWLVEAFDQLQTDFTSLLPRLLTPVQQHQVWASIIAEEGPALLRVDAAAGRAQTAWKLLHDWQLDLDDRRFADNEDGEAFRRWALRFRAVCVKRGFASAAELPGLLAVCIKRGAYSVPDRLFLVGIYDPAPALQELVRAMQEAGSEAQWVELDGRPGRARRVRGTDVHHEIAAAVEWTRRILLANPGARIGIVVPDLAARRSALAHRLGNTLDPACRRPVAPAEAHPWNLSLGVPLSRVPIVQMALELLSLMNPPVDTAALGVLLGSPHWGLPRDAGERRAELSRRALLDRRLRSIGDVAMPLSSVIFEADRTDDTGQPLRWACPGLATLLEGLLEGYRALPGRADAGAWAGAFAAWLRQAGWPRGRPLDSSEFQAVEDWQGLLSRLSSLGDFAGRLTRDQALGLLARLADEKIFQPRAPEASVQVLGLYEANSLDFDHLWVMGLQDVDWPPPSTPDPFIPLALQREHGMPHCTPERQWAWAARMTAQLGAAAAEVVFSWPDRDGGAELGCSPLIAHIGEAPVALMVEGAGESWFEGIRASTALEPVPAAAPIRLSQPDVRGGNRVYAHQAACPFRAFAEHRLGARPLDRPGVGLGPRRSGSLMHRVMEAVWRDLRTQAALLALAEQEMADRVRAAVEEVLEAQRRRSPVTMSSRYRALEARRLQDRVLEWLRLERQRGAFRVVELEQKRTFEAGGVRVSLTLDRVDELEDGTRVVLDYKTGEIKPTGWFGERPDDPQLPLYGAASRAGKGGAALSGVAFAQIRPDRAGFSGVVRDAGILPGLPAGRPAPLAEATANWPAVLDDWADVLERLAAAFREGGAEVDPRNGLDTCRQGYCELGPLCRIRERLAAPGGDSGDETDEPGVADHDSEGWRRG